MRKSLVGFALAMVIAGCASTLESPEYLRSSPKEVSGIVENWGKEAQPVSSTLSVWKQRIRESDYALIQLRVNLDTYRFALSREQLEMVIDAINNYQSIVRQSSSERSSAIGWLYRTDIKLKRLGESAKDDRLILNVERKENEAPVLTLTFDSWLLSFGGPDSPADRVYKLVVFSPAEVASLREVLEEIYRGI
ncbi:MAG: hypothetical protein CO150_07755 [Nitrospirae bacterium CG_4_9_14_3_um_filter_53_35]|nr:hypothetical protein [Deltaproteobacteria bacterium]OIP62102.1 MAG: hypothetical protein AUK29_09275 [Nitrospirae bacterium CG2_30_53_67]PIS36888.1 MAG: hypothetical protein COT35_08750 [Nitrospirae bacterium CG08_land_8_20_14_0_20_52_24]PIV84017.1 MAG: hypothetical protein COW52_07995 [Nitrospirae bacterium CG17_big_fil_post_rev_8_21_14_2_50_50_9]PIW84547.1 MAG: hypothetical protein COZ95_09325 [Nitrospirae bacterium CG_4_8_14_3_um_filter_50_41]PIX86304.1 MAG: hypothetical protein COZ32_03